MALTPFDDLISFDAAVSFDGSEAVTAGTGQMVLGAGMGSRRALAALDRILQPALAARRRRRDIDVAVALLLLDD